MVRRGAFHALTILCLVATTAAQVAADVRVYADALSPRWQDTSWGRVVRDLNDRARVRDGQNAVGVSYTGGWGAFELRNPGGIDVADLTALRFYIHGGTLGGQRIEVRCGRDGGRHVSRTVLPTAGEWSEVTIPLTELGESRIDYILWFSLTAEPQRRFYVDNIALVDDDTAAPVVATDLQVFRIDAGAERGPISPEIYGMNLADEDVARDTRVTVRRWGGNATSRYNWQKDASNRGSDWYFENVPYEGGSISTLPHGSTTDRFVEQSRRAGSNTLLTIPMIGWTAKSRSRLCGFGIAKYGKQTRVDPWSTPCGNGVTAANARFVRNDPNDTSIRTDPAFVQDWIRHLVAKYGDAAHGGVRYYGLDNEPMLWSQTHRDVHPDPMTYDELRDRTYAYAAAIKAVDPGAQTFGPVAWGWNEYFWSARDWASGPQWKQYPQDRLAHGNVPLVEWYLQQMRAYERQTGTRLLDYLDLHYYPAATGVALGTAGSSATQALRLRSTRSLWDPTYIDESWIGEPVGLIPRMRAWVQRNYPGTKLAISEYNWGGLEDINGALAQADVLGIFGREGVDVATLWNPPKKSMPGAFAFQIYRNYDGLGGEFGDVSLAAKASDPDSVSLYAAKRSADGALTILVINKRDVATRASIGLAGFDSAAAAEVYRYSPQNLWAITRGSNLKIAGETLAATLPPSSINLFVVAPSQGERYASTRGDRWGSRLR